MEEVRILAVGDLHGRSCWQNIDFDQYDKVVFLGDYVDSTSHSDGEVLHNLKEVIRVKNQFPGKVKLLLGNHDIQYLYYPNFRCSGFRRSQQPALTALFIEHSHLFQVAYQVHNYLFSHAGLSAAWYGRFVSLLEKIPLKHTMENQNLANHLNALNQTWHRGLLHEVGINRGGSKEYGGPTWADKEELRNYPLEGYHQVAGHNPVPFIEAFSFDDETSVTFIDVLAIQEAYYEVNVVMGTRIFSPFT